MPCVPSPLVLIQQAIPSQLSCSLYCMLGTPSLEQCKPHMLAMSHLSSTFLGEIFSQAQNLL
uniref:Uncharacterized protein n=1 Tax=Xenopus tropicalis TaxID=8364 RepID=A0A6I8RET8_XENTR